VLPQQAFFFSVLLRLDPSQKFMKRGCSRRDRFEVVCIMLLKEKTYLLRQCFCVIPLYVFSLSRRHTVPRNGTRLAHIILIFQPQPSCDFSLNLSLTLTVAKFQ